jgi:hypothetical protein
VPPQLDVGICDAFISRIHNHYNFLLINAENRSIAPVDLAHGRSAEID